MGHLFKSILVATLAIGLQAHSASDPNSDGEFNILDATCEDVFDLFYDATPAEDRDPQELEEAQDDVLYLVVWLHGYLSGREGIDLEKRPLGQAGIEKLVAEIAEVCEPDESARFLDVVSGAR